MNIKEKLCDVIAVRESNGYHRITFGLYYPSGKLISVWLKKIKNGWYITDMGMTYQESLFMDFDYRTKYPYLLEKILDHYKVKYGAHDVLEKEIKFIDECMEFISCIISISSLIFRTKVR